MNVTNRKIYIGSSINIYVRLLKHQSLLKYNKHENEHLQNSVNKYGIDSFIFFALDFCDKEYLTKLEQYYIDLLNPDYNITTLVERNILSLESRKKISETLKEKYKNGYVQTQHTTVKVYDVDGNYISTFYTIADFARQLNISSSSIRSVLKGKYKQVKGYVFYYENDTNIKKIKTYESGKTERISGSMDSLKKAVIITDTTTNETFKFDSGQEGAAFLNIWSSSFYFYLKRGYYKHYKIAPVKLDKLLENQEIDNQQPSQT